MQTTYYKKFSPSSDNIQLSDLQLVGPKKIKKVDIKYNHNDFYIQIPRFTVPFKPSRFDEKSRKYGIKFNVEDTIAPDAASTFTDKIKTFEEVIMKKAVENSEKWWGKKKSLDIIRETFKPCIGEPQEKNGKTFPPKFSASVPLGMDDQPNVECYDENKNEVSFDYLDQYSDVIPIIQVPSIWFVGSDWGITYKIKIMKIFKKVKISGFNAFVGTDDEDENTNNNSKSLQNVEDDDTDYTEDEVTDED